MSVLNDSEIAEFNEGDIVRIRNDIDEYTPIPFSFVSHMNKYRGQEFRIQKRHETHTYRINDFPVIEDTLIRMGIDVEEFDDIRVTRYRLNDLNGNDIGYNWSIFMFDLDCMIEVEYELEEINILFE